jgi:hypothetical protein
MDGDAAVEDPPSADVCAAARAAKVSDRSAARIMRGS